MRVDAITAQKLRTDRHSLLSTKLCAVIELVTVARSRSQSVKTCPSHLLRVHPGPLVLLGVAVLGNHHLKEGTTQCLFI